MVSNSQQMTNLNSNNNNSHTSEVDNANITNTPSSNTSSHSGKNLPLLAFLGQHLEHCKIHRCQLNHSLISQQQPMKLIYHYERLADEVKEKLPLQGQLLMNFDKILSREQFAQIAGLNVKQVSKTWQLKFVGKLVIFFEQPEIAMRLQWTNTLKPFEIIDTQVLDTAIDKGFDNWQFIDNVEIISKNPDVILTAEHPDLTQVWQQPSSQAFVPLPSVLGLAIQQFLHEQPYVGASWLPVMMDIAQQDAKDWVEPSSIKP